jgi:hypothetical protein
MDYYAGFPILIAALRTKSAGIRPGEKDDE